MRARIRGKAQPPKAPKQTLEQRLLIQQLTEKGYAALPEVLFHPKRKWRIDVAACFAFTPAHEAWLTPATKYGDAIAIEIDGGAFVQGRHSRGAGIEQDNEKIAALAAAGWRFIRVTPRQVRNGTALQWVEAALKGEAAA